MNIEILTSTPQTAVGGSGTFVGIDGLAGGLVGLGHRVAIRPLGLRSRFHTLDRWLYNAALALSPPAGADLVVGIDLDGFLWARRGAARRPPFVVCLKGIIADELTNERGWVRILLTLQARWERLNTERADLVGVTSRYQAEVARRAYGVAPGRIAVVPEAIDLATWRHGLAQARPRPGRRPTVLSVARMYARKRLADLLRAAALLRQDVPEVAIRVVGRGPEWAALERLRGELGLGGTVSLLGDATREQLLAEYANADVFCLPSVQEGFGIVFLEAMAAGLAVVACRAAAVPEVVLDGETGVLTPPRDVPALAGTLRRLLGDPDERRRLGAAGARRVEGFTRERVARAFLAAVQSSGLAQLPMGHLPDDRGREQGRRE